MLPKPIARQLKDGVSSIASNFENATILFTDMKGFTNFSSKVRVARLLGLLVFARCTHINPIRQITPPQLVAFLNTMFSKFDEISNKYGLYKVRIMPHPCYTNINSTQHRLYADGPRVVRAG